MLESKSFEEYVQKLNVWADNHIKLGEQDDNRKLISIKAEGRNALPKELQRPKETESEDIISQNQANCKMKS